MLRRYRPQAVLPRVLQHLPRSVENEASSAWKMRIAAVTDVTFFLKHASHQRRLLGPDFPREGVALPVAMTDDQEGGRTGDQGQELSTIWVTKNYRYYRTRSPYRTEKGSEISTTFRDEDLWILQHSLYRKHVCAAFLRMDNEHEVIDLGNLSLRYSHVMLQKMRVTEYRQEETFFFQCKVVKYNII